jgi:hypothetical protein
VLRSAVQQGEAQHDQPQPQATRVQAFCGLDQQPLGLTWVSWACSHFRILVPQLCFLSCSGYFDERNPFPRLRPARAWRPHARGEVRRSSRQDLSLVCEVAHSGALASHRNRAWAGIRWTHQVAGRPTAAAHRALPGAGDVTGGVAFTGNGGARANGDGAGRIAGAGDAARLPARAVADVLAVAEQGAARGATTAALGDVAGLTVDTDAGGAHAVQRVAAAASAEHQQEEARSDQCTHGDAPGHAAQRVRAACGWI